MLTPGIFSFTFAICFNKIFSDIIIIEFLNIFLNYLYQTSKKFDPGFLIFIITSLWECSIILECLPKGHPEWAIDIQVWIWDDQIISKEINLW